MCIMNVLAELHQEADLKLNLKFEIEVLCKNLNIDVVVSNCAQSRNLTLCCRRHDLSIKSNFIHINMCCLYICFVGTWGDGKCIPLPTNILGNIRIERKKEIDQILCSSREYGEFSLWNMMPCITVKVNQYFGGTYWPHLQG